MAERERKVVSEFIDLYRDLPCLWDSSSDAYKDTNQKNLAWEILIKKLKEIEPNANTASAKKKVENLRSAYKREAKKVKNSKNRAGSAKGKVHKPSLWYFDLMSFLDEGDDQQRSNTLTSDHESQESNQIRPKFSKMKRKGHNERLLGQKRKEMIDISPALLEQKSMKVNYFGLYVGEQLENMSTYQRQIAEKIIAEVIFLAKTENLNSDSRVETPSRSQDLESTSFAFPSHSSSRFSSPQYITISPPFIKSSPSHQFQPPSSPSFEVPPSSPSKVEHHPQIIQMSIPSPTSPSQDGYCEFRSPPTMGSPPSPQSQTVYLSPEFQSPSPSALQVQQHQRKGQFSIASLSSPQSIPSSDQASPKIIKSPANSLLKELLICKRP